MEYLAKASGQIEFYTDERCFITELCNTDLNPDVSLAIARVPQGVTTQLHSLTGIAETYIVITGEGLMEVAGETFRIHPGDQVVIPPNATQRVTAGENEDLQFYCLCHPRFQPGSYVNLEHGNGES